MDERFTRLGTRGATGARGAADVVATDVGITGAVVTDVGGPA